ncbi:MAG TPA: ethylbenzene dehydrogenase-related protein [Planctomycetota bacterium]|nr:ethylbenzene dehydrogenase-related protein [Planctomycetota bacterium]
MRYLLLLAPLLAACGEPSPPAPPPVTTLILEAKPIQGLVVDALIDNGWSSAPELSVPLKGGGAGEVALRAAVDGQRFYLLAIWPDKEASQSRYWKYEGDLKWAKFETEDAFSVCWSPGALADDFRKEGCAITCHGDKHVYPGTGSGFLDFWYWGAQQCALFQEARDMWLRQGDDQRLRGDRQPADSDNVPNVSDKYVGPSAFPQFRKAGDDRIVPFGRNLKEITPDWIRKYWKDEINIGREVPLDLVRARKGSRGDVIAVARHYDEQGKWVLELARDLATGNTDDLPLGLGPVLFAVAIHDNAAGAAHAISGPIELTFASAP